MVRLHKVYGNLMVDLVPTNAKLLARAIRLTALATGANRGCLRDGAEGLPLPGEGGDCHDPAGVDADTALQRINSSDGDVRTALRRSDIHFRIARVSQRYTSQRRRTTVLAGRPARADRRGDGAGQQSRRLVTHLCATAPCCVARLDLHGPYFLPFVHRWRFNGDFYPQIAGVTSVAPPRCCWALAARTDHRGDWPGDQSRTGVRSRYVALAGRAAADRVCIIIAAPLVLWSRWRGLVGWTLALMVTYSVLMLWVPVAGPDSAVSRGSLEAGRDTGAFVDRRLMSGHLWAQAKTGIRKACSVLCRRRRRCCSARSPDVFADQTDGWRPHAVAGCCRLCWRSGSALLDRFFMPINKSLWTPSYARYS